MSLVNTSYPFIKTIPVYIIIFIYLILFNQTESISGDEAYSIYNSLTSFSDIIKLSMYDQNPPLYLFMLKVWTSIFGTSELAARSLSALLATITIGVLYQLLIRIYARQIVFLSIFTLLISYSFIYFAQEARCYALVLLLAVLSLNYLNQFWHTNKKKHLVLYALFSLLLIFAHYLTVFFLFIQFIVIIGSRRISMIKYFLYAWIGMVILISPWLLYIISNMPKKDSFWLKSPQIDNFYYEWVHMFNSKPIFIFYVAIVFISILLSIFDKFSFKKIFSTEPSKFSWSLFFLLLSLVPSILEFIVAQHTPIFLMRYYYFSIIGVVVYLNIVLYHLFTLNRNTGIFFYLIFFGMFAAAYSIHPKKEEDWRSLVAYIQEKGREKSYEILVTPSYKTKELYYYLDRKYFENVNTFVEKNSERKIYGVRTTEELKGLEHSSDIILVLAGSGKNDPSNNYILEFFANDYTIVEYKEFSPYRSSLLFLNKKELLY
jgi:uncharacterized membrane protein